MVGLRREKMALVPSAGQGRRMPGRGGASDGRLAGESHRGAGRAYRGGRAWGLGSLVMGDAWLLLLLPAGVVLWSGAALSRQEPPFLMGAAGVAGAVLALAGAWHLATAGIAVGSWMLVVFGTLAVISVVRLRFADLPPVGGPPVRFSGPGWLAIRPCRRTRGRSSSLAPWRTRAEPTPGS